MTGMLGTYLAAAELTHKGLIVSVTSRNAQGADLLASDQFFTKTWSIQVKTNSKDNAPNWLLNSDFRELVSPTHLYIFINLRGSDRPEYYIVPSKIVAKHGLEKTRSTGSTWYWFNRSTALEYRENWSMFETSSQSK